MENMEKVVYLDNAATTACAPEALEMMVKALSGACGNPSSHYSVGYEAKELVDTGRAQVAKAINADSGRDLFHQLRLGGRQLGCEGHRLYQGPPEQEAPDHQCL